MSKQIIKVLPSPTWRWLKVNEIEIDTIESIGLLKDVTIQGEEALQRFDVCHSANERACFDIKVKKNSKGVICIDQTSNGNNICSAMTANVLVEAEGELTLIEIVRIDEKDSLLSGVVSSLEENAKLNVIQIFLGGKEVYTNILTDLIGKGSGFDLKSAYTLNTKNTLDINYVINHIGENTQCSLDSKGVLYKGARKIYRGTIDFKKGCKGAVGNEIEDCLLMDDDVVNKTIPVILCAEEDVEGNHGASIGNISEDLLFYLQNRGIAEEEIYKMMADARIDSVVRHIPDEKIREELLEYKGN